MLHRRSKGKTESSFWRIKHGSLWRWTVVKLKKYRISLASTMYSFYGFRAEFLPQGSEYDDTGVDFMAGTLFFALLCPAIVNNGTYNRTYNRAYERKKNLVDF